MCLQEEVALGDLKHVVLHELIIPRPLVLVSQLGLHTLQVLYIIGLATVQLS